MEIKNYLDQLIDLPKMLSDKLPWNSWNSHVSNSEKGIPGWINLFAKLIAVVFMFGALWGSLNYLIATQDGDQIFTDEMEMTTQKKENTGGWCDADGDGYEEYVRAEYEEVPLLDSEGNNVYLPEIDENGNYVYEQDMVIFNTGNGFLGTIGYLLAIFFWLYALFPVLNVIRDTGEEIASSSANMILFVARDIPLALIRAAGYIAALIALFTAFALTFAWFTSIDLGTSEFVWGDAGLILSQLQNFGNLGIMAIASVLGTFEMFGAINPEEMMMMLTDTMTPAMMVEWLSLEDLPIVIGAYWNVVVILIVLFVNLIVYRWVITLAVTFVNWISGPYFPHKNLNK